MALATSKTVTQTTVTLTLDGDEARALLAVTQFVGGHPEVTSRGHIDHIAAALRDAGLELPRNLSSIIEREGGIMFVGRV